MKGFENSGNTCYLNAAMHAVLHSPQLTNYFLRDLHERDLNKRRKNAAAFVLEYKKLVDAYWTDGAGVAGAFAGVTQAFRKIHGKLFPEGGQHDAHEAMTHILRTLHDGLARTKVLEESKARATLRGEHLEAWDATEKSIVAEIFQVQMASKDHSIGVHLPACGASVTDGFERVAYLPLVLIVQLQRFSHEKKEKSTDLIEYSEELDLRKFSGSPKDLYLLFGVVCHVGSLQSGHYTFLAKVKNRAWYEFDDDVVKPVRDTNIVRRDAYVLMYKRSIP
jgi:ubiquitin C-terminal hydrolase